MTRRRRNDETLSTIKLKCPGPDLILRTTKRIRIYKYMHTKTFSLRVKLKQYFME